jgi:hypothetical protein
MSEHEKHATATEDFDSSALKEMEHLSHTETTIILKGRGMVWPMLWPASIPTNPEDA